jgi:putative PIN family toxin of toxin-antitoxin system
MTEGEIGVRSPGAQRKRALTPISPLPDFSPTSERTHIVIDTNIVLDLLVFKDPATTALQQALNADQLHWLATQPMRDELARVLAYPQIVARLNLYKLLVDDVLATFDKHAHIVDIAPKASVTCSDADDQKFIDLAVAHKALLLSKDKAVTSMAKRLLAHGVKVRLSMS